MKHYIETKIQAVGIYAIKVTNEEKNQFKVGKLNIAGDDLEVEISYHGLRSEAIKAASILAIHSLTK